MSEMLFAAPVILTDFDVFWAAYPRCPRKTDKPRARRTFERALKKVPFSVIMDGLQSYPFSHDPQYIPMPATWLNGERWETDTGDAFDPVLRAAGLSPQDFLPNL